jgi:hypothetical protein
MLLTSLPRLRNYIGGSSDPLTDNIANNRELKMWLNTVSNSIEQYLNRSIEISSRTEYFDVDGFGQNIFYPKAMPIVSITSLYEDSDGLFTGGESIIDDTDYNTGSDNNCIVLLSPMQYLAKKALRLIYTGGLAYDAVETRFTVSSITGSWTAERYIIGSLSGAVGIYKSQSTTTFTVQTLYGKWVIGDVLSEQAAEDGNATEGVSGTIATITRVSLCEAYPELSTACEMEIRYHWKNKMNYENNAVNKDSSQRGTYPGSSTSMYRLRPETISMITPYKRYV